MMFFDPIYFLFVAPAMLLALYAQARVQSTVRAAQAMPAPVPMNGAQVAARILSESGVEGVHVEETRGFLSDHYDPTTRTLRLSPDIYEGRSLAAFGIAAHEAGHALQHGQGYAPLRFRNGLVSFATLGSNLSWLVLAIGVAMASAQLLLAGIVLFSGSVLFQLVNLPVELNASSRARAKLLELGLVGAQEDREVGRVLHAAALTYVAATVSSLLTLAYFVFQYAALGGGRRRSD
jgi:Zn-dependent membrane protease YugP